MSANLCISNSNITHESKFYNLENLSDTRKRLKLTQTDVAQKLYDLDKAENPDAEPLRRQTVGQWESGTVYIPVVRLMQLSKIYGVSMDYLMGLDRDYTNTQNAEIGRLTGLSDKAISNLTKQKETLDKWKSGKAASIIRTLNLILETKEGLEALQMIDNYVFADFELTRFKKKNIYTKRRLKEVKKKAIRISGKAILKDVSGTGLIQAKDRTTGNVQIFEAKHLSNAFLGSVTDCVVKLKVANEKRLI